MLTFDLPRDRVLLLADAAKKVAHTSLELGEADIARRLMALSLFLRAEAEAFNPEADCGA